MFHWIEVFLCNVSLDLICIVIIIIFVFCWFEQVSHRSYNVTLIPTVNKFHEHKQTQGTSRKENFTLMKISVYFCLTYATLSLRDLLFSFFSRDFQVAPLFLEFFFCVNFFSKKKWEKNERSETNLEVIVNSSQMLSINLSVSFAIINK